MNAFAEYLTKIENDTHRARMTEVLEWVKDEFPQLEPRYAWNQPMFTDHGTFIIGFSIAKPHISISPEFAGMEQFCHAIDQAGYTQSKMLFRIKWEQPINYELLRQIIQYNCLDKVTCKTFWRK